MPTDTVSIEKLTRTFEAGNTRYAVNVEIKPARAVAPYLNLDLLPVAPGSKALSITADIHERNRAGRWSDVGGGQSQDQLRADFPNDPTVQRLCDIWDAYHLCDMSGGTREQNEALKEFSTDDRMNHYTRQCEFLAGRGLLFVDIPGQFEEIVQDGEVSRIPKKYKYGSAWLCGALPAEVEAELRALMTPPPDAPKPASPEAENRGQLARLGIKMSVQHVDRNPNMPDWRDANHYKCTFSLDVQKRREQGDFTSSRPRRMTVYFSMGYAHSDEPTINEVFDTLVQDAATVENCGDFAGFCSELGYEEDSRKAERTWKASEHQAARLKTFLGEDLYAELVNAYPPPPRLGGASQCGRSRSQARVRDAEGEGNLRR